MATLHVHTHKCTSYMHKVFLSLINFVTQVYWSVFLLNPWQLCFVTYSYVLNMSPFFYFSYFPNVCSILLLLISSLPLDVHEYIILPHLFDDGKKYLITRYGWRFVSMGVAYTDNKNNTVWRENSEAQIL